MSSEFETISTKLYVQVGEARETLRVLYHEPPVTTEKTLVLIPGFNSLTSAWEDLLMRMKTDYRIFVIETSEKFTAKLQKKPELTATRNALDIIEVINYLMIDNYILVASSMSVAYSLKALGMNAISPNYSFLVGPVERVEIPDWSWFFVRIAVPIVYRIFIRNFVKIYIRIHFEDVKQRKKYYRYLDTLKAGIVRKSMLKMRKFKLTDEELSAIKSKCILVGYGKDKVHASDLANRMTTMIKDSENKELETNVDAHGVPLVELIEELVEW